MNQTEAAQRLEGEIIPPELAIRAMRDSGYRNTAYALSELIDNSVQAKASSVDVICLQKHELVNKRERRRMSAIGVLDNGEGTGLAGSRGWWWSTLRSMKAGRPSSEASRMGGWGFRKRRGQPHEPGVFLPKGSALLGHLKADKAALPCSGGQGLDCVPVSWCRRWGSKRQAQRTVPAWALYPGGDCRAPRPLDSAPCIEKISRRSFVWGQFP